jgi:hypothetical protein
MLRGALAVHPQQVVQHRTMHKLDKNAKKREVVDITDTGKAGLAKNIWTNPAFAIC